MNTAKQLQQLDALKRMMKEKPVDKHERNHVIRTCVKYFTLVHPEVLDKNNQHIKIMRETAQDQNFAEIDKTGMRAIFTIPEQLNKVIIELLKIFCPQEPTFCQVENEDKWFWKEFPRFRIANNI